MRVSLLWLAMLAAPVVAAPPPPIIPPVTPVVVPVDPAALASARQVAIKIWPTGSMERMMDAMSGQFAKTMTDSMLNLPLRDLVASAGLSATDVQQLGHGTVREIMAVIDPSFQQRLDITNRIMFLELGRVMSGIEPDMREALSRAYAKRFSVAQLGEISRFFNTPTGSAYAATSMQIAADPDYLAGMQSIMPKIAGIMPAIMVKVKVETDKLPKPRTYKELTPAERERIARLVGQSPAVPAKSDHP